MTAIRQLRHVPSAAIAVLVPLGLISCARNTAPQAAALDWRPNLDQPAEQLEEVLAKATQQQPMNYTIANISFVVDAKLYILFDRYLASLHPEARAAAIEQQRRWLLTRQEATHVASDEYRGGTFASFAGSRAFINLTTQRIDELQERINVGSQKISSQRTGVTRTE